MLKRHLLHVRTRSVRLRRHRLALDALSTRVVVLGILADAGRAGIGSYWGLAGALAFGVAGGVVGAETVLLGLLLLELVAGAGTAAGDGGQYGCELWEGIDGTYGVLVKEGIVCGYICDESCAVGLWIDRICLCGE